MMPRDIDIEWICLGTRKTIRKWIVEEIRYDFDNSGYCSHKLEDKERYESGTPFTAYVYAKNISKKYKKQWFDTIVVIREVAIK